MVRSSGKRRSQLRIWPTIATFGLAALALLALLAVSNVLSAVCTVEWQGNLTFCK